MPLRQSSGKLGIGVDLRGRSPLSKRQSEGLVDVCISRGRGRLDEVDEEPLELVLGKKSRPGKLLGCPLGECFPGRFIMQGGPKQARQYAETLPHAPLPRTQRQEEILAVSPAEYYVAVLRLLDYLARGPEEFAEGPLDY